MAPDQIALIRASYARLAPRSAAFGAEFYDRLFAINPGTRRLFSTDVDVQARKFTDMLGAMIATLDRTVELRDMCVQVGRRHDAYGVQPAHYDDVGTALIETLRTALGAVLDDATEQAWRTLYEEIAVAMVAAHSRWNDSRA